MPQFVQLSHFGAAVHHDMSGKGNICPKSASCWCGDKSYCGSWEQVWEYLLFWHMESWVGSCLVAESGFWAQKATLWGAEVWEGRIERQSKTEIRVFRCVIVAVTKTRRCFVEVCNALLWGPHSYLCNGNSLGFSVWFGFCFEVVFFLLALQLI